MMSLRAGFAAISLVILGAALGVAGDRLWRAHRTPVTAVVMDGSHAQRFRAMLDSLDLSDSQRVAIDGILHHFQANVDETWAALRPRLQPTMDSALRAIEAVFSEEQRTAFTQWLAVERQRMHGPDTAHAPFRH